MNVFDNRTYLSLHMDDGAEIQREKTPHCYILGQPECEKCHTIPLVIGQVWWNGQEYAHPIVACECDKVH